MSVTSHVYPKAQKLINSKDIDLTSDTFKAILFTGDASAFTATQEGYEFISDLATAYTEVTSGGYARVTLTSLTLTNSGAKTTWSCDDISFGSSITLSARSMAIADTSIGSAVDSATPVVCVIDFGETVASTSGTWEYDIDGTNGLATWTSS
jgi:hypothetical protein